MEKPSKINESLDEKMTGRVVKHATEQIGMLEKPQISRCETVKAVTTIYNTFSSSEEIRLLNFDEHEAATTFRGIGVVCKRLRSEITDLGIKLKKIDNELGSLFQMLDRRKLQTAALPDMVWDIDKMMDSVREIRNKVDESNPSEKQAESLFNALTAWGQTDAFRSAIKTDTFVSKSVQAISASRDEINVVLTYFQSLYADLIYNYKQLLTQITSTK